MWCTGEPMLLPSVPLKSSSLLLDTESHSSGCGTTPALDFLGILSTHSHAIPSCRHIQCPKPHKGGHWHCDDTRRPRPQGQHSDLVWSGLPNCDPSGATSMRETVSKWRKARKKLASGVMGAEQRMQEGRLVGLGLLRWEKRRRRDLIAALHCLKAVAENNKIHYSQWKDNREQTQAARWEIPIKYEEKKFFGETGWVVGQAVQKGCGNAILTGVHPSERLHLTLTTTLVQEGGRYQRSL